MTGKGEEKQRGVSGKAKQPLPSPFPSPQRGEGKGEGDYILYMFIKSL